MEHTLCVCDRMPSSFPVRIPQQNRTKQNEARPSLVLHSRIKSRAEALAWLVGLGGRRLVCGETAKETHFCSQVGCSLGELDSGDWATLELLQGWPGVLGPCLFTFSHPLYLLPPRSGGPASFCPHVAGNGIKTGLDMLAQSTPSWCHLLTYTSRRGPSCLSLSAHPAGLPAFSPTSLPAAFASGDPMTWLGTSPH